ncbi:hypothetical protein COLO4_01506 [Corchorus olitorius]|uniref:Uncharacterized protein n=1 Tax=Corchorus olitorius TaxID=93759 RepID=A0A1R3L2G0_9ROSI|nr:hypothetical protein COLO4_01506 [Corchorus olitorius]
MSGDDFTESEPYYEAPWMTEFKQPLKMHDQLFKWLSPVVQGLNLRDQEKLLLFVKKKPNLMKAITTNLNHRLCLSLYDPETNSLLTPSVAEVASHFPLPFESALRPLDKQSKYSLW